MEFFVTAMGIKQASKRFNRMGAQALDMTPAFGRIATLIFEIERATFDGQGRRGGGSWRQDSPEWLARKIRNGLDPRINHATLALRDSMTVLGAAHQQFEITKNSVIVGTDLPYADITQKNRPFIDFTQSDVASMRNIITEQFAYAWDEAA